MDYLSEYKDLYYNEIEHSERLNGKIANNITFMSIVGAGIIFLAQEAFPVGCDCVDIVFVALVFVSASLFLMSIIAFLQNVYRIPIRLLSNKRRRILY